MNHRHELLSGHRIVAEASKHSACHQIGSMNVDAPARHAMVRRLDHHGDTMRVQHLFNGIGDLCGQALLDLQPLGICLHDPDKFGYTHDAAFWNIGHPGAADNWGNVMFAMTFASTLMKMDPLVLKKVDPPVGPVWRAPTVSGVDLLVANKGRVIVPCQDRSRRRRWPKASLYKGLS